MRKIVYGAALLFALSGCSSKTTDVSEINKFLTDLSEVFVCDFNGPNADDIVKIDFAVQRIAVDSPDALEKKGNNLIMDADMVHNKSDEYFAYPISEDQSTNNVDFTKDGKYQIMQSNEPQFAFSQAKVLKERNDTLLLDVDIYACNHGWKGDINSEPATWESVDPENVPQKTKTMRSVLVRNGNGYRIISYTNLQK